MRKREFNKIIIIIAFFLCIANSISAQEMNVSSSKDFIFAQYDLRPMKITDEELKNIVDSLVNIEFYKFYGKASNDADVYYIVFEQFKPKRADGNIKSIFSLTLYYKSCNPNGYKRYCGYLPDMKFDVICTKEVQPIKYEDGPWLRFKCIFDKVPTDDCRPNFTIVKMKNGGWRFYNWLLLC